MLLIDSLQLGFVPFSFSVQLLLVPFFFVFELKLMPLLFFFHFILMLLLIFLHLLTVSFSFIEKFSHMVVLCLHEFIYISLSFLLHL